MTRKSPDAHPEIRASATLVKVPGFPSTSCGQKAYTSETGMVVGADSTTWSVRMPNRTIVVICTETGVQVQTQSEINRGNSTWFWPQVAIWEQHRLMLKASRKYEKAVEAMTRELGTIQRRIEVFGKFVSDEP